jgi:hypothetical protein
MALRHIRPAEPVESLDEIAPFAALPDVQPIAAAYAELRGGLVRIKLEAKVAELKYGLRHYTTTPSRRQDVEWLLNREEVALADRGGPVEDLLPLVARALEVLKGDGPDYSFDLTPNNRRADLDLAMSIIEPALGVVEREHETLRSEISRDVAKRLEAQHCALLVELYRAARVLSAAGERERAFRSRLSELGYTVPSDLLPMPATLGAVLALGNEREYSSQLAAFRRFLEARGILLAEEDDQ